MEFVELTSIVFTKGRLGKIPLLEKIWAEHYLMDLMFSVRNYFGCFEGIQVWCLLAAGLQEANISIRTLHKDYKNLSP